MGLKEDNLEKLRDARDKIGEVFESEVKDDIYDNGSLRDLSDACSSIEAVIRKIENRNAQ